MVKPRLGPTSDCQAGAGADKAKGRAAQQGVHYAGQPDVGCAHEGQRVSIEAPGHPLHEGLRAIGCAQRSGVCVGGKAPEQKQQQQRQQLALREPFQVLGAVLLALHPFLLFICTTPREVESVIIPILLVRKRSLRQEFDGGCAAGTCGDGIRAQTTWLQGLVGLCLMILVGPFQSGPGS